MSFVYKEKPSKSRFVEVIWKTEDKTDGVYMAPADGCWDLIFITENNATKVLFSGPTSRPTPTPYKAGNKNIGIRFKPGTFMTKIPAHEMLNTVDILPVVDRNSFKLFNTTLTIPTYDTVDDFITHLELLGFLGEDQTVDAALHNEPIHKANRSIERHFIQATGLPQGSHRRIRQVQKAVDLLQSGVSILNTAHEAEYADQAHMTRMIKKLIGLTPSEIIDADQPIIIEHMK